MCTFSKGTPYNPNSYLVNRRSRLSQNLDQLPGNVDLYVPLFPQTPLRTGAKVTGWCVTNKSFQLTKLLLALKCSP